ncbi:MAG: pyridoxamine 5'-phosphate oxidase family protein [Actinobacteria bacterium]|nr:pyridoxamine 5'-phosphate oxidase family protein [Actinomycetota bacterium]
MVKPRFFHPGEVEVQVASASDPVLYEQWAARSLLPDLNDSEVRFVQGCTFAAAATVDENGTPWASPLLAIGARLFTVEASSVVAIAGHPDNGDPLLGNLNRTGQLGVLFFDPSRRRRAKSMGTAEVRATGEICYSLTRNFGLCPKYIHKRSHEPATDPAEPSAATSATSLSAADCVQLSRTDTVFLASFYPDHGADVTHRGGSPGFLKVDGSSIEIPDYVGNGMFNTLGNLRADPRLALTDVDLFTGRTIHTTGSATVSDHPDPVRHPGANRVIQLEVDQVVVSHANVGTWTNLEASPHNPPLA